ncbi:LOW QUALITY PROTEIN: apolipoprotein F [Leptodactylus fuscus]
MALLLRCVIFLLLHPYLYSKPYNIGGLLKNATGSPETVERPPHSALKKDFSLERGNQTCNQLLKDCKEFLGLISPSSSWLLKPAMAEGLLQVGCLTEQDPFFLDLISDEAASKLFDIIAKQLNNSVHQSANNQQHSQKLDLLRFNLESLHISALSTSHHKHCSGIHQEEQNVDLKGFVLGFHSSLQHAKSQCDRLGPVCAGISSDTMGQFKSVARNGGYIIPQAGSKLWLHHCIGEHLKRRSTDPECHSEKELQIHKVMRWIPGVSGYYNAGSAIYYATQGCTDYAEDRAIEASVHLGYDALFVATGGVSGVVGAGVGIVAKPAIKEGVKSAIDYFKGAWSG